MTRPDSTAGSGYQADWRGARGPFNGDLLLPGSAAYEAARIPAIARFQHVRPAAVLRCRTAADVTQALALAKRCGLPWAIRSGGHDFAGRSSTTGLLIDLTLMNTIRVSDNQVSVGPGVHLGDLYQALHAHGCTIPAGSGLTVGVAGLTLGGGFGLLGRRHGLLCDSLISAEVVLPDGQTVTADQQQHPDLFWLLRGAGAAAVGIVTDLVFDTVPAPTCTMFGLTFNRHDAAQLVDAWQHWAPAAPDGVAASLLLTAPADPPQPPQVTVVGTAADLGEDIARHLLRDLLTAAGAQPLTDHYQPMSWIDARHWLSNRTPADEPSSHAFIKSEYFRQPLPRQAIAELVDTFTAGRVAGEARELDFSPWAGAYNRVPVTATAFPHRREQFLLKHSVAVTPHLGSATGPSDWLSRSWHAVRPWGSGGVYANFPDADLDHPDRAYYAGNLDRIDRIRAAYDSDGLFRTSEVNIGGFAADA